MKRVVKGEIVSSTFDEPPDRRCRSPKWSSKGKAKSGVRTPCGHPARLNHQLARAYNTIEPHSGRILTGSVDANALHKPKRFFDGAQHRKRRLLTIIATALVETGSKMAKSSSRNSREQAIWSSTWMAHGRERESPAINVEKSGTRRNSSYILGIE